ncbi:MULTISPECIES: UDP-glucose dehydrogenase family protein [Actinoalloteichus]|uniref:UDP-glucose 6-dehydrogenase n=1 Tax=Actinoalloteichus fjordicus TaxID=1612552 RepID=A0AAC9PRU6_9PSEU|nr:MULTISPECIES: UDP-glucose/GDP-mannose dehydrogenase family protein [Actinoalloteichus]APU14151.1 nucleotide sugar dehydrogenase [Actinoalloteichus fjordicus]APU20097.1 nucleotide sugar dehydrogenase [Actinoalloteichus sp. GBA129-24]
MASRVGVVGAGYVGLTSAACLARLGRHVTCVDNDRHKIDRLHDGEVTLVEPGLSELVAEGIAGRRLRFTTDLAALADVEVALLCLPTPMGPGGVADLGAFETVLADLGRVLRPGCVVVTKSTVPMGTARRIPGLLGRSDLPVVGNPEFLREGHAVADFLRPDRIVIGADAGQRAAADRVAALYAATGAPVLHTDPATAEVTKYASNAFLAVKASYANVLADLCERVGADVTQVTRAMGFDDRIGPDFLAAGPGWGGSCLPKDAGALLWAAEAAGVDFALVRDAVKTNTRQHSMVVRKVRCAVTGSAAGSLVGVRIGVLGLAFKAGTGDLRASPAVAVVEALARQGALISAHDPGVSADDRVGIGAGVRVVDDPYRVAEKAMALVVLTEWPEFRDLDWRMLAAAAEQLVVVDTRNLLDQEILAQAGFRHIGIGTGGGRPEG